MNRKDVFILILVYLFGIVWIVLNKCLNLSITLCPTKITLGNTLSWMRYNKSHKTML